MLCDAGPCASNVDWTELHPASISTQQVAEIRTTRESI
jgi:carbonic anhydrase